MNLWRLFNARVRVGRARLLLVMATVAIATGAVIIGVAERLTAEPMWEIPGGVAGALLTITAASFGQTWASARIGQRMAGLARHIRRAILTRYVALEPPAFAEIDQGAAHDALAAMPRGLARLGAEAPAAVQSFLITIACIVGTLLINPVAGAALLLALKLGAVATTALVVRARGGNVATQIDAVGIGHAIDKTFQGLRPLLLARTIPSPTRETPLEIELKARSPARKRRLGWIATESAAGAMGRPLLAALIVGATRLSNEPADQAVAMLLIALLVPFDWVQAIPRITALSAAADRLAAFEASLQVAAQRWASPSAPPTLEFQSLEVRNAIFRYAAQPGQPGAIVGPVSCSVAPGQILLISGGLGSGKTSILKGLAGLAVPEGGSVLRDGVLADARRNRDIAAFVAAEPLLFARTAIPNIDRPDIESLIEELDLGGFKEIRAGLMPETDGLPLGVRARIALLAAIAGDRPLLLIDEWGVGQSPVLRERLYRLILPRLRASGRAIIIATRDDRFADIADQIIRLDDGQQIQAVQQPPNDTSA